jgi:plastocyanin
VTGFWGRAALVLFAAVLVLGALGVTTSDVRAATNSSNTSNSSGGGSGLAGSLSPLANDAPDYVFTFHAASAGTTFVPGSITVPAGTKLQLIYNSSGATLPHDVQVYKSDASTKLTQNGVAVGTKTFINPKSGNYATPVFAVPSDGLVVICSVHGTAMEAKILVGSSPPSLGGGGAATQSIVDYGVHFYAYWVGVISFAVLFILYGASFFLFKHGETPFTTDQKDRPDYEERRTIMGLPEYVFVILAIIVLALAVVLLFKIFLSGGY